MMFSGDGCFELLITLVFSTLISIPQHLAVSTVCSLLFNVTVRNVVRAMVHKVSAVSFVSTLCSLARATRNKLCTAAEDH